jgi:hypothetical protein
MYRFINGLYFFGIKCACYFDEFNLNRKAMTISKQKILSLLTVLGLSISGVSQASLTDRGGGMIYDDVLDITWLQDANYAKTSGYDADGRMSWAEANEWVSSLRYGGYNDWRLPGVAPVNGSFFDYGFAYDGSKDEGYNISNIYSELGYMFYENLGNNGKFDNAGIEIGCTTRSYCLTNTGLFDNFVSFAYRAETEYSSNPDNAWILTTFSGYQISSEKDRLFYAWAVRSGDIAVVPVPAAVWLMGSGLIGLIGMRKKKCY